MAHTHSCCQKNKVPFESYLGSILDPTNTAFSRVAEKQSKIMSFTTATRQEMKQLTDDIATENRMILPKKVWVCIKGEMDATYHGAWSGLQKKQVVERVWKCRATFDYC